MTWSRAYFGMIAVAAAIVLLVQRQGGLLVPREALVRLPEQTTSHVYLLLALLVVVVMGRGFGAVLQRLGQPPVIGEILAGLAMGPSLLGAQVFLQPALPVLGAIAQLGIILYMFSVGLSLDTRHFQGRGRALLTVSHASIIVPFVLGVLLALYAYPRYGNGSFTVFSLFMGISLAVTAFPVLARILTDRNLQHTPIGMLALACAAADDVTAWCILALVVAVARADLASALPMLGFTLVYVAVMLKVIRPLLGRLSMPMLLCGVLASALITEAIGIHAVFGAFFLGALVPHDAPAAKRLRESIDPLVSIVFLPAFFAFTGMRTDIGLLSSAWLFALLFTAAAIAGKFGGAFFAARFTGSSWRDAAAIGVLMNTRGLMELVVLNIGLELGILSPTLFTVGVLMALVTTLMTAPALSALRST